MTFRCERPTISIVVPAYNERENLPNLYEELLPHLDDLGMTWEIVFVDDGSTDGTWEAINALHGQNKAVRGLRFSRNFGHQYALYAGLSAAAGDAVICMDADLQHPPEVIPELVKAWKQGYKIVHTARTDPKTLSAFKRLSSRLYYRVFSLLAGVTIQPGMADFRLLDRHPLQAVLQFEDENLFLRGIVQWVGYRSTLVPFQCRERHRGTTKYPLRKMLALAASGVISFSVVPLRIGILVGILTTLFAAYLGIDSLYAHYRGRTVPGWTTTTTMMSFMFGMLFILLGLIGEYIGRVLMQVRARPRFIVSEVTGIDEGVPAGSKAVVGRYGKMSA